MSWDNVKLSEVASISAGQSAPKETLFTTKKGIPFIRAGHLDFLTNGGKILELPTLESDIANSEKLKLLPKGAILFAKSGMSASLNRVYLTDVDCYYVSHLASISPSKEKLDSSFCKYFLEWYKPSQLIKDPSYPSISLEDISKIKIPLPSLPIQQKIAAILDQADALRKKDRQLLTKYDELLQAVFYDMFGDPVRNEKGWEKVKLKSIIRQDDKINYGVVQPGDEYKGGIPIIRVGDLEEMMVNKSNLKRISPEIEKNYKRSRIVGDEILIGCVGSIGTIALADETLKGFNIVRATARVRVEEQKANRLYIANHLKTSVIQNYFIKETRTVSQPTLNISHIEETPILLPPIELQKKFASLAENIKQQKQKVKQQITQSENLFQSLLQWAFKGELVK